MKKALITTSMIALFLSGCASVPMEHQEESESVKKFNPPPEEMAGIYIFRKNTLIGSALKKDTWIDNECIGETAMGTFFYHEVEGNKEHTVSTESEFSPNDLVINTNSGENYFIQQYIKPGIFVGGANLRQYENKKGMEEVSKLNLAKKGHCSSAQQIKS
jgi:hypothetical protein